MLSHVARVLFHHLQLPFPHGLRIGPVWLRHQQHRTKYPQLTGLKSTSVYQLHSKPFSSWRENLTTRTVQLEDSAGRDLADYALTCCDQDKSEEQATSPNAEHTAAYMLLGSKSVGKTLYIPTDQTLVEPKEHAWELSLRERVTSQKRPVQKYLELSRLLE